MSRLEYTVGVDLGSTTTKAVVLDQHSAETRVLGVGITNSRSNYDVACQVALGEALVNTRFARLSDRLDSGSLASLQQAFREEQYRTQLEVLAECIGKHATRMGADKDTLAVLDQMAEKMAEDATKLFADNALRKSDFFRDLAGNCYMQLAEEFAKDRRVRFDLLAGLFDKAILEVENSTAALSDFGTLIRKAFLRLAEPHPELQEAVQDVADLELVQVASVGTGYGRARLPFPEANIRSEILCHGLGAHHMFPATRTVLDIGGQDTKAIQVDDQGIVTSFQMNDRCAAGCGRYLGYIADEMNLGLHELGPLAGQSTRRVKINSTCTVFAGAELRERLSLGEKREDILAGLHRAIVLRAMSLLARSGGVSEQFTFTGGVAKNSEATKALRQLIQENYGERTINISPDSIYTGALGAALFGQRDVRAGVEQEVLL